MDKDAKIFYLFASVAAALASSRLTLFSLIRTIFISILLISCEIFAAVLFVLYGYTSFSIAVLAVTALTFMWATYQVYSALKVERELRDALALWSKEISVLSGSLIDTNRLADSQSDDVYQKIRIMQRFLELISSPGRPSI